MKIMDLQELGSKTAKDGFRNEKDIAEKFNAWVTDPEAQEWLRIMGYVLSEIEHVEAIVLHGYKSDLNVQIQVKLKNAVDTENLQVKLVKNKRGFNQIDKRWIGSYCEMWAIPTEIATILRLYTGELPPTCQDTRDKRRMFIDEFSIDEQEMLLSWFRENKVMILCDIIKGRGQFAAEWILVSQQLGGSSPRWVLRNINEALQIYGQGDVEVTKRGSLKIGSVLMQRKGGDGGRSSARMLQFKIDPTVLFEA